MKPVDYARKFRLIIETVYATENRLPEDDPEAPNELHRLAINPQVAMAAEELALRVYSAAVSWSPQPSSPAMYAGYIKFLRTLEPSPKLQKLCPVSVGDLPTFDRLPKALSPLFRGRMLDILKYREIFIMDWDRLDFGYSDFELECEASIPCNKHDFSPVLQLNTLMKLIVAFVQLHLEPDDCKDPDHDLRIQDIRMYIDYALKWPILGSLPGNDKTLYILVA